MRGSNKRIMYAGVKGMVVALDRDSGQKVWRTDLKGSDFVNLVLDGNDLFATARGEIFCLDPATGSIRWNNPLRGMGRGVVTLATPGAASSSPAAAQYQLQQEQAARARSHAAMG